MTTNNINLNIVARADTKQARSAIRSLSNEIRLANRDNANALNIMAGSGLNTMPINRIRNDFDELTNKINKGKLTMSEFGRVFKHQNSIIRRQAELGSASLQKMGDSTRGFERGVLMMDDFRNASIRGMDRMRLFGSAMRGLSTHIIDFGKNMQWAGRQITVGFSVPFGIAAGLAARQFMKLEDQIIRFEKVFNENLGTPLEQASTRVQRLAETLTTEMGRAAEETLEVAATFAQMGKNIDQVEELTRETMRLSTLGEIPVNTSTDLLRGIQAVYGATNEELVQTVDLLNAIENNTSLTTAAMADSLPQVLPIFEQFNLELGEGVAIIAGMNEVLGNANEAATAFKAVAQRIYDPTQEAIDKFASVGINIEQVVERNKDNLIGFYRDLGQILEDMNMSNDEFAATFGNLFGIRQSGRALTAVSAIYDQSTGAANDYSRALDRIGDNTANAADAQTELDRQLNSLSGRFRVIVENMKVQVADIGRIVLEVALPVIEFVGQLLEGFSNLDDGTKKMIITASALVAAFGGIIMIGGIFANLFGNFVKMFGNLLPGMAMFTAESQAASLAMETQDVSAKELLNTYLGLDLATDNLAASQAALATSVRNASSAMAGQAGKKVIGADDVKFDNRTGRWSHNGTFIANSHPAVQERMLKDAKSPKRSQTRTAGARGAWSGALMAGGMLGSAFGTSPEVTSIANTAMLLGMIATFAPGLKKIGSIFKNMKGSIGGAHTALAGFAKTLGTGGGAKAAFGGLGMTVGAGVGLAAAVAAIGVGFGLWRSRVSEANNELMRSAKLSRTVAEQAGIELGKGSLVTDDVESEPVSKAQKVIRAFQSELRTMQNELGISLNRETQFKKLIFDISTRGDEDLETIKAIIKRGEIDLGIKLDIDTSSLETVIDSLADAQMQSVRDSLNVARSKSGSPGVLGFGDRFFQFQKINDDFKGVAEEMAERLAGAMSNPEMLARMSEEVQAVLADVNDHNFENFFVDTLASVTEGLDHMGKEFNEFNDVLAYLSQSGGEYAEELAGLFDGDYFDVRQAKEKVNDSVNQLIATMEIERPNSSIDFQSTVDNVIKDFKTRVGALTESGVDLEVAINNATDEMMKEIENMPPSVKFFIGHFRALLEEVGLQLDAERVAAAVRRERFLADRLLGPGDRGENTEAFQTPDTGPTPGAGGSESELKDTSGEMRSALTDALNDLLDEVIESIEEQRDSRISAIDEELELLKDVRDEEEERDKLLEERYRDQMDRMRQLRNELQLNIDYDAALARGDLDSAAAINQERLFAPMESGLDELSRNLDERSRIRDEEYNAERDILEKRKDDLDKFYDEKTELIKEDFELLKRTTPKTIEEWRERSRLIEGVLSKHGVNVHKSIESMAEDAYHQGMENYRIAVEEDNRWEAIGKAMTDAVSDMTDKVADEVEEGMNKVADAMSEALWGGDWKDIVSSADYKNSVNNDKDGWVKGTGGKHTPGKTGDKYSGDWKDSFKSGGHLNGMGYGAIPAILHGGEFIMRRDAVQSIGVETLERMNAGKFQSGGLVGDSENGGLFGAMFRAIQRMFSMLSEGITGMFGGMGGMLGGMFGGGSSGGGGNGSVDYTPGSGKLSIRQIFDLARGQGLTHGQARLATAIALGESGGYPGAHNPDRSTGDNSYGLWQINMLGAMGPARRSALGISSNSQLWNPSINARAMHMISGGGSNWNPWTVYSKGIYRNYLDDVDRALSLRKGGRLLQNNVLANLHKGEAVLRAPVAKNLEKGIQNLANSGNGVNLTVKVDNFHGTEDNIDALAKAVCKELDKAQAARGRRRVYGT